LTVGFTLSRHVGWKLTKWILLIFLVFLILMMVVDFSQLARWIGRTDLDFRGAILASILRGPSLTESMLPFAVLFAAIVTFVQLNRQLELTVTRAAGVSAWQILLPACTVAFVIGAITVTLYNPAAAALREVSVTIGGVGGGNVGFSGDGPVWLRQNGDDGPSIIGATRTAEDGTVLAGVTAFIFNEDGTFRQRVDATTAHLEDHEWVFEDPVVTTLDETPVPVDSFSLNTSLTLPQIRESLADPETVPFWRLPGLISIASATSLPANDLRLQLQALLSLPLLLVAMILIAAAVSLKFSRTLKLGRLIVTGAGSGFVLYVILVVSRDLGRGGVVSPTIAAWAPVLLAVLASVSVLLREEDG
jgi:lipopolysaccharide export system permease protein